MGGISGDAVWVPQPPPAEVTAFAHLPLSPPSTQHLLERGGVYGCVWQPPSCVEQRAANSVPLLLPVETAPAEGLLCRASLGLVSPRYVSLWENRVRSSWLFLSPPSCSFRSTRSQGSGLRHPSPGSHLPLGGPWPSPSSSWGFHRKDSALAKADVQPHGIRGLLSDPQDNTLQQLLCCHPWGYTHGC